MKRKKNCILVVGGAGYIGAHMCKLLAQEGYHPVVLDNLARGHKAALKWGSFVEGSMADGAILKKIFSAYHIEAVMHFAAFCYVGESVENPRIYYRNNVADTINLLNLMIEAKISNFIFSSSCATYGEPLEIPIRETHPQNPINPYGRTKLMVEQVLDDLRSAYEFESISLRYFNAAGADPEGELGEDHRPETHLIPLVLQTALGLRQSVSIFGDDYATEDGTCVRDYIHINDLAQAHLLALEHLLGGARGGAYNLGNGDGYSVRQVIQTARRVTGKSIPTQDSPRRSGDPAVLVGSSTKIRRQWGWQPKFADLHSIIETAWEWHRNHPNGFTD